MGVKAEDSRGAQNEMQKRALFAYFADNTTQREGKQLNLNLNLNLNLKNSPSK